ncbi:hypothetical protein D3C71_1715170 [compost metagenome]
MHQRQPAAHDLVDAIHRAQRLLACGQHRDQLGDIHGRAPAHAQHQRGAEIPGPGGGLFHHMVRRIGLDIVADQQLPAMRAQRGERGLQQPAADQELVGHGQHPAGGEALRKDCSYVLRGTRLDDDLRDGAE